MKSINFTVLIDKVRSGEKDQTFRTTYIPDLVPSEKVMLKWKKSEKIRENIKIVEITEVFPIRLKDITDEIAKRDGFDSPEAMRKGLEQINKKKFRDQDWGFVIRWKPIPTLISASVN